MHSLNRTLAIVVLILLGVCSGATEAQPAGKGARGVVSDESGGVLPGVTVVATLEDARVIATAVTDGRGRYAFEALPDLPVRLTLQLEGFANVTVDLDPARDADAWVASRLALAPRTETVVVRGEVPVLPPPVSRPPSPLPPPPRVLIPVPEHDHDSVCGPAKASASAEPLGTIRSGLQGTGNELFAKDDEVNIDGGTRTGLDVGRNVVVRRHYRADGPGGVATGEHTAALLQIVAADERASVAVVVYACDEVMRGDFLAPFEPEPAARLQPVGTPAYDNAARILFGDLGQSLGVARRLMVIDRGRDDGVEAGQRLTLFRRSRHPGAPLVIGDAVVVAVRHDSATIRVDRAIDAISPGDGAAPQRPVRRSSIEPR